MKNVYKYFALFAAIIAFSFATVNAQSFSDSGTKQSIERQVEKKILRLPRYEVFDHIGYSVDGDTVTLYGKVLNGVNKNDAAAAVRRIPGVGNVVNNIEILPPSPFDDSIRTSLYRKVANWGGLSRYLWPINPSVRLIVDGGRINLEGYVSRKGDLDAFYAVARTVPGAFTVTNNLKIDRERAQ
jgi:hyperosmotically inducible periplasmic protein